LIEAASGFEHVKSLDLGGGLGVVERKNQSALDLSALDDALGAVKGAHPQYELWLEPGRFVVAEAGVILGTVTQTKEKGDVKYVGTDIGMHTLIRPALYGAFHEIVNLSRVSEDAKMRANIVGPIWQGANRSSTMPQASPISVAGAQTPSGSSALPTVTAVVEQTSPPRQPHPSRSAPSSAKAVQVVGSAGEHKSPQKP